MTPRSKPESLRTGAGGPAGECGAGRGASTLTSRSEGPTPLAALADTDERSAARGAVPSRPQARPGRADGPRARRAPSRPAAAAPCSAPAGRGGERRRAASTRFPGRRANGPSLLQTSSRQPAGCSEGPPPSPGQPAGQPPGTGPASVTNFSPHLLHSPHPPAIFSITLPRCLFHGIHFSDGGP